MEASFDQSYTVFLKKFRYLQRIMVGYFSLEVVF